MGRVDQFSDVRQQAQPHQQVAHRVTQPSLHFVCAGMTKLNESISRQTRLTTKRARSRFLTEFCTLLATTCRSRRLFWWRPWPARRTCQWGCRGRELWPLWCSNFYKKKKKKLRVGCLKGLRCDLLYSQGQEKDSSKTNNFYLMTSKSDVGTTLNVFIMASNLVLAISAMCFRSSSLSLTFNLNWCILKGAWVKISASTT